MSKKTSLNSYSPEGRIYQLEYAMKASNLGTTTIALVIKDSAILISEKKIISKLQNTRLLKKHHKVYDHIALAYSGISGDAKTIVAKARDFCLYHEKIHNELAPVEGLLKYLAKLSLKFSEKELERKIFSRPFGVNVLFCGFNNDQDGNSGEPFLFSFDPSGSYRRYKAKAIGGACEAVEQELGEVYDSIEGIQDGIEKGLGIVKRVMKDKMTKDNVEICVVDVNGVRAMEEDEITALHSPKTEKFCTSSDDG